MAGRHAARRGARGGEIVPAARTARARLTTGGAALLLAGGTGAWLAVLADDDYLMRVSVLFSVLAVGALAAALVFGLTAPIPIALALLGAEYAGILALEADGLDARAPLLAGALLGAAELSYWSLELRAPIAAEPGTHVRRIALLAALVVAVVLAGGAVLLLVAAVAAGGTAFDVLGAAAALGAVGLLALAARRAR